jgi:hypothetical protein
MEEQNKEYVQAFRLWLDSMLLERKEPQFIIDEYSKLINIKKQELELCNNRIERAVNSYNEWAIQNNEEQIQL